MQGAGKILQTLLLLHASLSAAGAQVSNQPQPPPLNLSRSLTLSQAPEIPCLPRDSLTRLPDARKEPVYGAALQLGSCAISRRKYRSR
jgi:hypothetical protein